MFLAAYKVGVNARLSDKLFMLALLDYASVIDNKYPVGVTHRFQSVRDHDYRLVARQRFDSLLQSVLVFGVDMYAVASSRMITGASLSMARAMAMR